MTVGEYIGKMRALADEMAAAGKPLDDEDLVSYIVASLDIDYNPVVSAVLARTEPITVTDLYTQLLSFEQRMDLLLQGTNGGTSANVANRGARDGGGHGNRGGRNNRGRGNGRGRGGFNNNNGRPKIKCQVCKKEGHSAAECWHRFDENYIAPEEKSVNSAGGNSNYGVDTNWYTDTGSTDHITGDLDKMTLRDRYNGGDQIHAANGAGMNIEHIGRVICHTPERDLILDKVLHVPSAAKNLISVHRLASDNNAYLEFHPDSFYIKDQTTKSPLLEGRCRRGLYPLPAAALKN